MSAITSSKSASSRKEHTRKHRSNTKSTSSVPEPTVNMMRIPVPHGQLLPSPTFHATGAVPVVARPPHVITAAGGNTPFLQAPFPVLAPGSMRMNIPGTTTLGLPAQAINGAAPSVYGTNTMPAMVLKNQPGGEISNYKDYSRIPLQIAEQETVPEKPSGKDDSFPVKLHQMLSEEENAEYICWLPHGRSWRIVKPKAFEARVVPQYFKHAKYASFMRQVNGWGFKRITEGPDHNSYYHEVSYWD